MCGEKQKQDQFTRKPYTSKRRGRPEQGESVEVQGYLLMKNVISHHVEETFFIIFIVRYGEYLHSVNCPACISCSFTADSGLACFITVRLSLN